MVREGLILTVITFLFGCSKKTVQSLSSLMKNLSRLCAYSSSDQGRNNIDSFARQLFVWFKPTPLYMSNEVCVCRAVDGVGEGSRCRKRATANQKNRNLVVLRNSEWLIDLFGLYYSIH